MDSRIKPSQRNTSPKGIWAKLSNNRLFQKNVWIACVVFILLMMFPIFVKRTFYLNIFIFVFMYALLGVGWNIIGGYAGQPALGNALFFGLGAYTSGLLLRWWGISPWVGMLVGLVVAAVVSVVIGYPTFRLSGHYFAIATITLTEVIRQIFNWWPLVGGQNGVILPVLPESLLNFQFHSSRAPYYYIILGFLIVAFLINYRLEKSKLGYLFRAIKADEQAAASLGVNVSKTKLIAFALSAILASAAGTFYAQFVLFFDPASVFFWLISIQAVLVAMLGGLGELWGPLIGSGILVVASELTRVKWGGTGRAIDLVIYGAIIVILAVWEPKGLVGLYKKVRSRLVEGRQ